MARESEKPIVFRYLFDRRYNWASGIFTPQTVTSEELQDAIVELRAEEGISLAVANPANFLKDFLRNAHRNSQWPQEIAGIGYTARQSYSDGRVFDFVPYAIGQTVPFPDAFELPNDVRTHRVEALSMPLRTRQLARGDESWLVQVCVSQRILQTHFALFSEIPVCDFVHLQSNMKGTPEIDALFLICFQEGDTLHKALVTFEAKRDQPVVSDQIRSQVAFIANRCSEEAGLKDVDVIVPVAAATRQVGGERGIAIFEMEGIPVADALAAYRSKTSYELPLSITQSVAYLLGPTVVGI